MTIKKELQAFLIQKSTEIGNQLNDAYQQMARLEASILELNSQIEEIEQAKSALDIRDEWRANYFKSAEDLRKYATAMLTLEQLEKKDEN